MNKIYTEEDLKNAFEESRLTHPMVGFKHDTFEQYISQLPNQTMNNNTDNFWNDETVKECVSKIVSETLSHAITHNCMAAPVPLDVQISNYVASKTTPIDKEYEVLSWVNLPTKKENTYGVIKKGDCNESIAIVENFPIYSIKRLSDNQSFSIGDDTIFGKILGFSLRGVDGRMSVEFNSKGDWQWLSSIQKATPKPVLFTTNQGLDIIEGQEYWCICTDPRNCFFKNWTPEFVKVVQEKKLIEWEYFATKEEAAYFSDLHKPNYSLQEIREELERNCPTEIQERIIRKLKNSKQ